MNLLRQWQIALVMLAIFLVGGISGSLLTLGVVKRVAKNRSQPQNMIATAMRYYERQLALTPEQVLQLEPVFRDAGRKITQEIAQSRREVFFSMQELHGEIEKVLTPEQAGKFKELREQARSRAKSQADAAAPRQPAARD